ncbi:serine/threonine protein kinase [Pyxidicoccus xibeiensis]|uniref:serine/threonine protein kinase n=1 Tax=Pyxidicoccus xibeiensis TaxID=2906759 RepID=UPI0020A7FFD4|nr:serine/threonine-protein kinase [Pyxidicoccus xibeiensis]MCP3140085.1 serine/threonine protein kinase [Pyxidicoccus xibeiensis]
MSSDIPQVNPDTLPPGTVVGGCWRLLERLGVGGYGAVYKVEATDHPGRYFALKLSRQLYEPRARRELTLLMDKAVHAHVVAVHACGRWPDIVTGHFFFVMDWVPGPALHLWADLHNPSFQQLADAARRVSLILDAIHAGGVLHRDLKPEHILMRGPHGDPVLIDFGSGDYLGAPTLTLGPLPPGTLHMRSPEAVRFHQRHWRRLDARYAFEPTDDLYSLGVCLYRAATGHYPFAPEWPPDVLCAAIVSQQPPAPSEVNPRVPPSLSALILRLLEKDPAQRFETGAELHEALTVAREERLREPWETPLFEWHEAPVSTGEGAPVPARRVRRPEWPSHKHRPPSVVRARLLRLWAEVLGWLRPPPKPTPYTKPREALLEGRARRVYPGRRRALVAAGGLAMVAVLVALGARAAGAWGNTTAQVRSEATAAVGQKVASPAEALHTVPVAVPPPAEPTPAAVAPRAASSQEAAPVNVKKTDTASKSQVAEKKAPTLGARAGTAARTLAMCGALGCASTPPLMEQPLPPPEDCPPASMAAMKRLRIPIGAALMSEFVRTGDGEPITVREGRAIAYTLRTVGDLSSGAEVDGYLYVTPQRVYGRFTQVRYKNERYPGCFELWELNSRQRGFPREPGGDAQNAIIVNNVDIRAVHRFQ